MSRLRTVLSAHIDSHRARVSTKPDWVGGVLVDTVYSALAHLFNLKLRSILSGIFRPLHRTLLIPVLLHIA